MKVTRIKKLMISGISTITNNELEMNEESSKIPQLWEEYFQQDIYKKTLKKEKSDYMYGVYSHYQFDEKGDYKVTVGVEVTKPKNAIVIEDKKYLVFSKQGELPMIVTDLWEEIWDYFAKNDEYERAFEIDFEKTFKNDTVIHLKSQSFQHTFNYGIALEFTFDEEEFYEIDYYGIFDNYKYDDVNIGLETEFDFYKENKFHYENSSIITYYNKGEFEAGETENEPSDYEILETSLDFSNKDKIFWWFSEEELQKFIKRRTEEIEVEKSLKFGENSFIEFKPSLLYNFKTK